MEQEGIPEPAPQVRRDRELETLQSCVDALNATRA
jgi:hypothetical protein